MKPFVQIDPSVWPLRWSHTQTQTKIVFFSSSFCKRNNVSGTHFPCFRVWSSYCHPHYFKQPSWKGRRTAQLYSMSTILRVLWNECQVRTCSNYWKVTLRGSVDSGRESHRYRNNRSGTATVDKDLPSDGITLTAPYLIFVIYFLQYHYVDMSSILRAKDSVLCSMTDQICSILWNGFIFRLVVVSSKLLAYYFA